MSEQPYTPRTLLEAIRYFSDPDVCLNFVAKLRWSDGPVCPDCQGKEIGFLSTRRLWKCKACKKQFSVKVGTIFEDSPLGLDKWLTGIWLIAGAKNGISSYEVHRALGITQKSAWFMMHRIRLAMQAGSFEKLKGEVEADETFIGGLARNMHKSKLDKRITGPGPVGKSAVMGLLERRGKVLVKHVKDIRRATVQPEIRKHVEPGSEVFTDYLQSYIGLSPDYIHQAINHMEAYAKGKVHTNGLENFWSLLKRMIKGTYVHVAPFHLFRYLDEESMRFNERLGTDADRFLNVLSRIVGRRLTFKGLIGKAEAAA
jgi:transposase-like protein